MKPVPRQWVIAPEWLGETGNSAPWATSGIRQCLLEEGHCSDRWGQRNRGVRQSGKVKSGEQEGFRRDWIPGSSPVSTSSICIYFIHGTSDTHGASHLVKKTDLNQMLHAFTKEVLNFLCNKHGGCYEEKVHVMRDLTSPGVLVNFTDGISRSKEVRLEVRYQKWI